jgi:hypothetical protein
MAVRSVHFLGPSPTSKMRRTIFHDVKHGTDSSSLAVGRLPSHDPTVTGVSERSEKRCPHERSYITLWSNRPHSSKFLHQFSHAHGGSSLKLLRQQTVHRIDSCEVVILWQKLGGTKYVAFVRHEQLYKRQSALKLPRRSFTDLREQGLCTPELRYLATMRVRWTYKQAHKWRLADFEQEQREVSSA